MSPFWCCLLAGTEHAIVFGVDSAYAHTNKTEQNPWFTPNHSSRCYGELFSRNWAQWIIFVPIAFNMHFERPAEGFAPSAEGFR